MTHNEERPTKRYRIKLRCTGVPERIGNEAAADITNEFLERPWHQNVTCIYEKNTHSLILDAKNDYDENGRALMDEFSDAICAYIRPEDLDTGDITVESAKQI